MVPTVYRHQTVWQSEIFLLEVCPAPPARSLPTQTASQYPAMICWELRGGLPPSSRWDYTTVSVSHPTLEGWRTGGQEDSLVSWCRNKWLIYNWTDRKFWYLLRFSHLTYRLCSGQWAPWRNILKCLFHTRQSYICDIDTLSPSPRRKEKSEVRCEEI